MNYKNMYELYLLKLLLLPIDEKIDYEPISYEEYKKMLKNNKNGDTMSQKKYN